MESHGGKKHTFQESELQKGVGGPPVLRSSDNEQELAVWMLLTPECPGANFDQPHIKQFLTDENTIKTKGEIS